MRSALPNRRPSVTAETIWTAQDGSAHPFTVTIGFDPQGKPQEVFANHAKGALAAMLADACVLVSIALQHGITPDALGKSLGRVPVWDADAPASPLGTIIEEIRKAAE